MFPGLMEALNPRKDEGHGSTEEVCGGASARAVWLTVDTRRDPRTRAGAFRSDLG